MQSAIYMVTWCEYIASSPGSFCFLIQKGPGVEASECNGPYAKFLNRAHLFFKRGIFTTCDCYSLNNFWST